MKADYRDEFPRRSAGQVLCVALFVALLPGVLRGAAADLYVGSGAKAGEITDRTAIVIVRLTTIPGQDAQGLIPGRSGQARLHYGTAEDFRDAKSTEWETAVAEEDHGIQFLLAELKPASRYYYRVEFRAGDGAESAVAEPSSFVTAPAPDRRAGVMFHLTTCQDIRGESTYRPMAAQRPDFCVSAGDTVYYDGQGNARNVPQAWQAYQKMFGLPAMQDYYRHVGGYFMKDDHDYRFNDSDPYMKGRWVNANTQDPGVRLTETRGNQRLDVAWLTHAEGIRVFKQVFPLGEKTHRTVRWGQGLQIWMLENRDFRSPNNMPDGPEKSIWGKVQKAWLMETLLASDADYRIIISPNPIIGPDRLMKGDNHANLNGFWHEGQAFLDWLKEKQLENVILMCGDRHWQYHSIDRRNGRRTHEFSCGPTSDEHVQAVPPLYEGVERPYAASRGGFMSVRYEPGDRSLAFDFYSMTGEPLYQQVFRP
jgi:alkaline phosphatase D